MCCSCPRLLVKSPLVNILLYKFQNNTTISFQLKYCKKIVVQCYPTMTTLFNILATCPHNNKKQKQRQKTQYFSRRNANLVYKTTAQQERMMMFEGGSFTIFTEFRACIHLDLQPKCSCTSCIRFERKVPSRRRLETSKFCSHFSGRCIPWLLIVLFYRWKFRAQILSIFL